MEQYYIFRTDRNTDKTNLVCCGSHETREECIMHWQCCMYGFMDAMQECGTHISEGQTPHSLIVNNGSINAEYFMLMGAEGQALVYETANA